MGFHGTINILQSLNARFAVVDREPWCTKWEGCEKRALG